MEQNNDREGGRRVHSFIPSPEARTIGSFVCFFPSIGSGSRSCPSDCGLELREIGLV